MPQYTNPSNIQLMSIFFFLFFHWPLLSPQRLISQLTSPRFFCNSRLSGPRQKKKKKQNSTPLTDTCHFIFLLSFVCLVRIWCHFDFYSLFFFLIVFLFISLFLPDKHKTLLNKFFLMFTEILTKNILIIPYIFGSFFFHLFCFAESFFFC